VTDKQRLALLRKAHSELELTKEGYDPKGGHWRRALGALQTLEDDLSKPPKPKPTSKVPNLGPVWRGGKSILLHDLTHATGGIPLYPAFDDAFVAGRKIIAPEALVVTKQSNSHPGDAFYAKGASGIRYWFGHLVSAPATGRRFRKGETIGVVLDHSVGGGPHVHVGINVEDLLGRGKQLEHRTNYSHGAAIVGDQLRKALA
jgi:hypothetical protein